MEKISQFDRVTWSESVRVNIADYEHKDFHMSYSTEIKDNEKRKDALLRAKKFVQLSLRESEKKLRKQVREFVDFDTMAKL